jgi:hypothetical protein
MPENDEVLRLLLREADRLGIPDEEIANLFMEGFFDDLFDLFGYQKKVQGNSSPQQPPLSDADREKAFHDLINGYDTNPEAALYYKQILQQAAQYGGVFVLPAVDYTENEIKELEAYLAHRGWEKTSVPGAHGGTTTAFKAPEKELALVKGDTTKPSPPAPEGDSTKPSPPAPEGDSTKPSPPAPEGDYTKMSPEQKAAYEKMLVGDKSQTPAKPKIGTSTPTAPPVPAKLSISDLSEPQMVVYDKALTSVTQKKMPYYVPTDIDSETAAQVLPSLGWKEELMTSPGERGKKGKGKAIYAPPGNVQAEALKLSNALRILQDVYYPSSEELRLSHIT